MIPRLIHVSWPHQNLLEDPGELVQQGMRRLRDLNPDWQFRIYEDQDIQQDLWEYFCGPERDLVDRIEPFVAKVDLWRLMKIYTVGGMYCDIDRLCDQRLAAVATNGIKCVLPTNQDWDFSQDFMMSEPGNPIYSTAMALSLQRRSLGSHDVYWLGPQTYMNAVTRELFGAELPTNPGADIMQEIRRRLQAISWLSTYSESPPYDTVLYRGGPVDFDFLDAKARLYQRQGVRHWESQ